MIAKGKSISHGTSAINYSMAKDKSKLISIWGMSEVLPDFITFLRQHIAENENQ